jgi:transcriptional regulator with XRE-family HTH domain
VTGSIHTDTYRRLIGALVEARNAAGLTQQALANRLGKPQSYVAKVEGFERRLDVVEFLVMAREIGADPAPMFEAAWKEIGKA